ncbi:DNA cytosine methyltransferase [Sphaerimonospora mesophila]|uniref:DNA cytosine methyltransferase n=1 Tax=Sphaerimonospora mesophila TaxID=37483 RepID=UPI0006E1F178
MSPPREGDFRSLEICAGAGGQALGLERAGFSPVMLIDDDAQACATLRVNRPNWRVLQADLKDFVGSEHDGVPDVDLLSGGVPSAPYSVAGKQQGTADDRDLLRASIFLAMDVRPRAIMIENIPTLLTSSKFIGTRNFVEEELRHLGYRLDWQILEAQDFGVPQTRRSSIIVAMRPADFARFTWPEGDGNAPTVGQVLRDSMASRGWVAADEWAEIANRVAPTIVGGSKKHGGADLGPSRTKRSWMELGVDGSGLADNVPGPDFPFKPELGRQGLPKLTVPQVARIQGFPPEWIITGRKTSSYRQVAQSFPPPVATALGRQIALALVG